MRNWRAKIKHVKLHHVAMSVSNLEAMSEWYQQAFELVPGFAFSLPGFRVIMSEAANGFRIEFFQAEGATRTVDSSTPLTIMRHHGFTHLALDVPDLMSAYNHVMGLGAESVWAPRPSPEPGKDMAFVRDPEGNLIELIGPETEAVALAHAASAPDH